jgi:lipoprotein NlpI
VYGNLGICHAQLGQKSEALAAFDKALELDPRYEPAIVNKAITQSLEEGEKLNTKIKTVQYYKDFPMKNISYLQHVMEEGFQKPEENI